MNVDTFARAFLGGVDDLKPQMWRNVNQRTGCELHFPGFVFDVCQTVDIKLEDFRGVLNTQPVTCAQVLVHTYTKFRHDNETTTVPVWPC